MNRKEVLDIFIQDKIDCFSLAEREEELHEVWSSNWSNVPGWDALQPEIRETFQKGIFPTDFADKNYDEVLFFKFRDQYKGYRNDYLERQTGLQISTGKPTRLEACPCCGWRTIEKRYDFEICTVCWWEDDGQDNDQTESMIGSPNDGLSITNARLNVIRYGIYNSERKDLIEFQDEPDKFDKGRVFEIQNDFLVELGTEWKAKISRI
jgi:hypothetical protein